MTALAERVHHGTVRTGRGATIAPWRTATGAWGLLWTDRGLHARAIWAPIVFLVAAEFLYHRVMGNAHGVSGHLHALLSAPWWMPILAAACWLAGLKFLLSFSISWRRHLLLRERFDAFFFHAPFWRYLGFLVLTYVWIVPLVIVAFLVPVAIAAAHAGHAAVVAGFAAPLAAFAFALWAVVRQVPFFTELTLDPPHPGWRDSTGAMRGTVWRYLAAFILAMIPVVLANLALDTGLKWAGADRHAAPVALGESAFRQAMLFIHFALGAALGAVTTKTVLPQTPSA